MLIEKNGTWNPIYGQGMSVQTAPLPDRVVNRYMERLVATAVMQFLPRDGRPSHRRPDVAGR